MHITPRTSREDLIKKQIATIEVEIDKLLPQERRRCRLLAALLEMERKARGRVGELAFQLAQARWELEEP